MEIGEDVVQEILKVMEDWDLWDQSDRSNNGGHNYRGYYTGDQGSTPVVFQSEYDYEPIQPTKTHTRSVGDSSSTFCWREITREEYLNLKNDLS